MKKVLYITTTRADYWIMRDLLLNLKNNIDLKIMISGMHLSKKYGLTANEVKKDFNNAYTLKMNPNKNDTKNQIIKQMSLIQKKFNKFLQKNKIDYLMLLGDRSEILPFAICAAMLNIPIIHFHGGETTNGAYDEFIRHSITMMSSLHLTSTEKHKKRVQNMGKDNVYNIGSLGCLNFYKKATKIKNLKPIIEGEYYVVLFHPETIKGSKEDVNIVLNAIDKFKTNRKFVFIGCNNDINGNYFNEQYIGFAKKHNHVYYPTLNNEDYINLLLNSKGFITNSSSGLIEVPILEIPIINIGNRQLGRERSKTIINCNCDDKEIIKILNKLECVPYCKHINPYFKKNSLDLAIKNIILFIDKN